MEPVGGLVAMAAKSMTKASGGMMVAKIKEGPRLGLS